MVTDCFPPSIGGIENHVYALTCELAALGHHVTVVTHSASRPYAGSVSGTSPSLPEGVELFRLPGFVLRLGGADPALDPRMVGRFERLVSGAPFDVAHGHTLESPFVLTLLRRARSLGLATVVTKHSMVERPQRLGLVSFIGAAWMAAQARRFDYAIAVSDAAAGELASRGTRVATVANGIDSVRFGPDATRRQARRAQLGYPDEAVVVGFMSRFIEGKGVLDMPEVISPVAQEVPSVRCLMVGDGPQRGAAERRARELQLSGRFSFVGFQPWHETPSYLNAMDIFAFPSRSEGFGLALLEAMASGLPCVTRDDSGTRGLVRDGETAFVADSIAAMAERIAGLARNPNLRAAVGHNARIDVASRYSWRAVASMTVEVYRKAIARHRGGEWQAR